VSRRRTQPVLTTAWNAKSATNATRIFAELGGATRFANDMQKAVK
jgi:hypothetical protein